MRPNRRLTSILAAAALVPFAHSSHAAVITVPSAQAPTITIAINLAVNGDEIVVQPGIYFEAISLNGKTLTLRSASGPESTIIDGLGQLKSVVRVISGEGATTLIEGFTIRNGVATAAAPGDRGGAIYCNLTSPTIRDCILVGNQAVVGGAIYTNGGAPKVELCSIIENDAVTSLGDGGAIYANATALTLTDCEFLGCSAVRLGGAIRGIGSTGMTITRCRFEDNAAGSFGGAIDIATGAIAYAVRDSRFIGNVTGASGGAMQVASATSVSHQFTNCVFLGNGASANGAGLHVTGRAELNNCTLVDNTAGGSGGASFTSGSGILVARNSVVWGNIPTGIQGPNLTVTYTCHQGAIAGAGNITADPMFVSADRGDLRLTANSPCIDAGNTTLLPSTVATDLLGLARAVNVKPLATGIGAFGYVIDMGAFEFPAAAPPSTCPGDLDGDGAIGAGDLATLLGGWGFCPDA